MRTVPSKLRAPNSKLKIVVLGTRGFPNVQGGVEKLCEKLYPALVSKGCEAVVYTRQPYVDTKLTSYKGVRLIPLKCIKNKYLEALFHTLVGVFAAKRIRPDIIHIHGIGPGILIPIARLLGMKTVLTIQCPDYERKKWGPFAKRVLKMGEYLGCRWADRVIAVTEPQAEFLRCKYKRDVNVIPNGVDIPRKAKTNEILTKYGLEKEKYILAVGRFVPEKGFHDLIDGFAKTQDTRHMTQEGWKLVIVGDADHEDDYSRELKRKADSGQRIVLTGFQTGQSLQELYSHAGMFVIPSYFEGLPFVLLEAMSYQLSCLASDIPANRELRLDEERYFKPGDVDALSGTLQEFIQRPIEEQKKAEQIERLRREYNWQSIAGKTLEVYQGVFKVRK